MRKQTNYDPEFKLSVVKEYLSDDSLTQKDICEKYSIPDSVFYLFNDNFNDFISSYDFSDFFVSVKK
ncbi:hypothetical protein JCM30566_19440 [Marinitoga arctica]